MKNGSECRLTFIVSMDRADMPLEMFAAVETFATVLDSAHIGALFLLEFLLDGRVCGRYMPTTAFLGEIGYGYGEIGARARTAPL